MKSNKQYTNDACMYANKLMHDEVLHQNYAFRVTFQVMIHSTSLYMSGVFKIYETFKLFFNAWAGFAGAKFIET